MEKSCALPLRGGAKTNRDGETEPSPRLLSRCAQPGTRAQSHTLCFTPAHTSVHKDRYPLVHCARKPHRSNRHRSTRSGEESVPRSNAEHTHSRIFLPLLPMRKDWRCPGLSPLHLLKQISLFGPILMFEWHRSGIECFTGLFGEDEGPQDGTRGGRKHMAGTREDICGTKMMEEEREPFF